MKQIMIMRIERHLIEHKRKMICKEILLISLVVCSAKYVLIRNKFEKKAERGYGSGFNYSSRKYFDKILLEVARPSVSLNFANVCVCCEGGGGGSGEGVELH